MEYVPVLNQPSIAVENNPIKDSLDCGDDNIDVINDAADVGGGIAIIPGFWTDIIGINPNLYLSSAIGKTTFNGLIYVAEFKSYINVVSNCCFNKPATTGYIVFTYRVIATPILSPAPFELLFIEKSSPWR